MVSNNHDVGLDFFAEAGKFFQMKPEDVAKALHLNYQSGTEFDYDEKGRAIGNGFAIIKGDQAPPSTIPPTRAIGDYLPYSSTHGVSEYGPSIPPNVLRLIPGKNPVVGAGINTRCMQVKEFSGVAKYDDEPGWKIEKISDEHAPTKLEREEMLWLTRFFENTGRTDFDGCEDREDRIEDCMSKIMRDQLEIDRVAIELRRDNNGRPLDFWVVDGGTIRRVYQGGFTGGKSAFNPGALQYGFNSEARKKLIEARIIEIPEQADLIAFVQMIEGQYTAAWERGEMIFDIRQKRTDIRFWGEGYSPLEQAQWVITGFLNGLSYNSEAFNRGVMPKMGLAFEDKQSYSPEMLEEIQDQMLANFRGYMGSFRMPLFTGKVTAIPLGASAREMEYKAWMEMVGALTLAIMGIDSAELGLRFQQAQNVLSENADAKMKFSKSRGLIDGLRSQEGIYNRILRAFRWQKKYRFKFTGLKPEDEAAAMELDVKSVTNFKTINELRSEKGLKSIGKTGDIILNPTFLQAKMMESQSGGEAGEGGDVTETEDQPEGGDEMPDPAQTAEDDQSFRKIVDDAVADTQKDLERRTGKDIDGDGKVSKAARTMLV